MGWADDMYDAGHTSTHGGLMDEHDDGEPEWENRERKQEAFWESLNISEAKLSKFCFTRILDVRFKPLSKESGKGNKHSYSDRYEKQYKERFHLPRQISIELEGVGWIPLAPINQTRDSFRFLVELVEYWEWFSVIKNELEQDLSLSHLKGNLIFCSIDNNQVNICIDDIYSLNVESEFKQQINDYRNRAKHCFCINLPVVSFLDNATFVSHPRVRQDTIDKNNLKVYQSKKTGLFFIQTKNKQTLFFREMKDTNVVIDTNIDFFKHLMEPGGYHLGKGTYSDNHDNIHIQPVYIHRELDRYISGLSQWQDTRLDFLSRRVRNFIDSKGVVKDDARPRINITKLPEHLVDLLDALRQTLEKGDTKENSKFDRFIHFNHAEECAEKKAFFESLIIPDVELSKLYLSRIMDCKVTNVVEPHSTLEQVSIKLETVGWVELPPIPSLPLSKTPPEIFEEKYFPLSFTQKAVDIKCYEELEIWFRCLEKEFSKDKILSHLKGNIIFCSIDNEQGKFIFDQIYSLNVTPDVTEWLSFEIRRIYEDIEVYDWPIASILEKDFFIEEPRSRIDSIPEDGLKIYEFDEHQGLFYFQTKNKNTIIYRQIDDVNNVTKGNIKLVNLLLEPDDHGSIHLESIKNYNYHTISGGTDLNDRVYINKEIERRKRRNHLLLENRNDFPKLNLGGKVPNDIRQILSVLDSHAKGHTHNSNPAVYKAKIDKANGATIKWLQYIRLKTRNEKHPEI